MSLSEIYTLFTLLTVVLAGALTIFRFIITREQYPKLHFELGLDKLGVSRDKHIIELSATITNKGMTRQYIRDFRFNILTFDDNTPFNLGDPEIEKRLKFNAFDKGLNWTNSEHPVFVDGGMSHQFTYVTALDKNIRFVMIYSKFDHHSKRWWMKDSEHYRISKTFAL